MAKASTIQSYRYCEHSVSLTKHLVIIAIRTGIHHFPSFYREQPIEGFLDDYSFLIKGLIDFYLATMDVGALKWAKELQDTQDRLFLDSENGGYFYSQANSANVIVRLKEVMMV